MNYAQTCKFQTGNSKILVKLPSPLFFIYQKAYTSLAYTEEGIPLCKLKK
jgi:hypothetical protein